jgi:methyl-accepting chemotaxis protein
MLNNLKIGTRLGIGYAATLILLLVIAVFAYQRIFALSAELDQMGNRHFPSTVQANNIIGAVNLAIQDLHDAYMASGPAAQQSALDAVPAQSKVISDNLMLLQQGVQSDQGKSLLANVNDKRAAFVTSLDKFVALLKGGERDQALVLLQGELRRTQNDYTSAVNDLIGYQGKEMQDAGKNAESASQTDETLLVAISAIAALLTVFFGFVISRSITGPVGAASAAAGKMALGDFSFELESRSRDEVGEVVRAVSAVKHAVEHLIADADMLSQAAVEGHLSTRADASKHQGDFRRIVQGVNNTLDAVITPLNETADYVDRISKGNTPPRISSVYKGDYNTIKNNLNACIDAVNRMLDDANMLAEASSAGIVSVRADASKHQGDFAKIFQGVNTTLDGVIDPFHDVLRVMTAMAQGDMTQTIDKQFKGDIVALVDAINNTVLKLADTVSQIILAADALTDASAQVSSTAHSLSQASSEQASSVEETTSSLEQMTASVSQNTDNAKVTDNMAAKAAKEAVEGGVAVGQTVEAMKSIADKIGIIDDIAYQTNLLALNAAIEAARAGDHGKGFAVVAAEVRKLAERSQVAAQEIGQLAGSSVKRAEQAGHLLEEMVPNIQKTSDLVQEIASASQEQSTGVAQINTAMGQLNKATQQNASASEELAATAEELGGQAGQLQELMGFFKVKQGALTRRASAPTRVERPAARNAQAAARHKAPAALVLDETDFEKF